MAKLNCPKCREKMDVFFQLGVEIDQCNACGGVWLDKDEWNSLTRSRGKHAVELEVVNLESTGLKCPRCPGELQEGSHSKFADFKIDHCVECGGGFFDRGEMARLLAR